MDKKDLVASIVEGMAQSFYDPQSETKQIRENLDVKVNSRGRHVTVALKNRDMFEEVLILVDVDNYASPNSPVSFVKKLTREEHTTSFNLNNNRYVSASVGDVYVPILFLEY